MTKKRRLVEAQTATVDVQYLRRAVCSLELAGEMAAEALKEGQQTERERSRKVIAECFDGISSIAFALLPKDGSR